MAQLPLYLTSEIKDFTVGTPKVLESFSKHIPYGVVFEDDGDTGYFYAASQDGILDALHIYKCRRCIRQTYPQSCLDFMG